jgi:pimeloyl-ACP methyl ester carboxylesterase
LSDAGVDAATSPNNDAGAGGDAEAGVISSGLAIGGYLDAQDEAQATLDAARALASMFSSGLNGKTALVGHTQGAHAVLSATALQPTYAPDVQLAAVATYAPFWLTMDIWGFLIDSDPKIPSTPAMTAMSVWYHYSHGELLDGVGHGLDVFAASAKPSVLNFVHDNCWGQWSGLGSPTGSVDDLYDPNFVSGIGFAAGLGGPCFNSAQCTTWLARYAADRPSLAGSHVPLLLVYGGSDQILTPDSLECVLDRFRREDGVAYSLCVAPGVGNAGILRAKSSYVAGWLGAQTLGETATETCTVGEGSLFPDAGDGGDASASPACPADPRN